jgi:hypothetical protein
MGGEEIWHVTLGCVVVRVLVGYGVFDHDHDHDHDHEEEESRAEQSRSRATLTSTLTGRAEQSRSRAEQSKQSSLGCRAAQRMLATLGQWRWGACYKATASFD